MKRGYLSEFFSGIGAKTLSAVEADISTSHQHEFNGDKGLVQVFGRATGKSQFPARFIYLSDNDEEPVVDIASVTWYDARERHPSRSEHRLYFPTNLVSMCAAKGDLLVIGKRQDSSVLVIVAQGGSTIANQVQWLFNLRPESTPGFSIREELETEQDRVHFTSRFILEQIGVVVESTEESFLETMLRTFGETLPSTREFSAFARSTVDTADISEYPDSCVMSWMEREEILFRTFEKHIIAERLSKGFENDVDGFLEFSLSVQNRRKSRVGFALENHMEVIFQAADLKYQRSAPTEGRNKADFLFPGSREYKDSKFDTTYLTMLGVKTTCKDRWRQVLAEADRISPKHLLTLEPSISTHQTDDMSSKKLQLVIPRPLHATYTAEQRAWLLDVSGFVGLVRAKQPQNGSR
jgi:hypothetical protein